MARKKFKFDSTSKKVYEVKITPNISESSSTAETKEKSKARLQHEAERARRRAKRTNKVADTKQYNYDILVLYHQLNYDKIQAAVKDNNFKCSIIDNNRLWMIDVDKETMEKAKIAFIACHFETSQHKQYRVRFAAYRHVEKPKVTKEKKKSNDTKPLAQKAKATRKAIGRALYEKNKKGARPKRKRGLFSKYAKRHSPGTQDTSSFARKLSLRIKKAMKHAEKAEKVSAKPSIPKPAKPGKPKQQELKFAA